MQTPSPKLVLAGSRDSTLAATMASLGAVDSGSRSGRNWPPYGSALAIELFLEQDTTTRSQAVASNISQLFAYRLNSSLSEQKTRLKGHYVRIRYNGQSLVVPSCRGPGRNWQGDERVSARL